MSVLLAYSRTPEGDAALAAALEEARRRDTGIVVVHVLKAMPDADSPFSTEQVLDAVIDRVTGSGVSVELRELPAGPDEAETILDVVSEIAPDVVVLGVRRRSRVGKFVLGSTTQRILLEADCPVLAVKTPA